MRRNSCVPFSAPGTSFLLDLISGTRLVSAQPVSRLFDWYTTDSERARSNSMDGDSVSAESGSRRKSLPSGMWLICSSTPALQVLIGITWPTASNVLLIRTASIPRDFSRRHLSMVRVRRSVPSRGRSRERRRQAFSACRAERLWRSHPPGGAAAGATRVWMKHA